MRDCDLKYFLRKWKVLPVPPPLDETPGHVMEIRHLVDNWVAVVCTSGSSEHPPYIGKYNPVEGWIEWGELDADKFIGEPGVIKDRIRRTSPLQPEPWTAEDAGGVYPDGE